MIIIGSAGNASKEYFAKKVEKVSDIKVGVVSMGNSSGNSAVNTNHNGYNEAAYFVSDENFKRYLELTQKIK